MTAHEKALEFVCPVCDAQPREECHRIDGHMMAEPHSDRRNLVLGVKSQPQRGDEAVSRTRLFSCKPRGVALGLTVRRTLERGYAVFEVIQATLFT